MKDGEKVTVIGKIVDFQVHQLGGFYPDYPNKENFQHKDGYYAIYFKEKVTERGEIEIQGTVKINILNRGNGDVISLPDILVDNWRKI
ncbi:MAG: hypothetical protein ACTSRG_12670 [Candidatus Helarchaeota archaeon]